MKLGRFLQVVALLALLACLTLALQATPLLGEGWSRARILYAGSGMVTALALLALGSTLRALARIEARLAHLPAAPRRD